MAASTSSTTAAIRRRWRNRSGSTGWCWTFSRNRRANAAKGWPSYGSEPGSFRRGTPSAVRRAGQAGRRAGNSGRAARTARRRAAASGRRQRASPGRAAEGDRATGAADPRTRPFRRARGPRQPAIGDRRHRHRPRTDRAVPVGPRPLGSQSGPAARKARSRCCGHRARPGRDRPRAARASAARMKSARRDDLRNVAIIAHVDHGKTTLVDALLKQSHVFAAHEQVGELIMDSNVLEREKGITILAKTTSIRYRGIKINIIDTPGHADFGGEVERVLGMADGCLLLVDALEGPMTITRVVVRLALELGLAPIIVVNKIDRVNARPAETVEMTHDLLLELAKHSDQLSAPVIYTNARAGTATADLRHPGRTLEPLLDALLAYVPPPKGDPLGPLQLLVSNLDHDNHIGRLAIGRIARGTIRQGQDVVRCSEAGIGPPQRITTLLTVEALQRRPAESASAGEIVSIAGRPDIAV